ncbi:MAG: ATP-grasp domain-containing protein [Methylococcales symbiont of Iophon sp. n. MRB-2018]|nr:MAG: ATP-grasp domain-containing protein [Methylococcales symbiont of Iophon sp. n. MRB-2018]KAF3979633.1 MAG: ATP-grasp domain-containing protein [Methylococcales symbiont of Iophon sp. n. MRB-2018]
MIKHILVFEYITGGGFAQQELPASLANEGQLMLNALIQQLAELTAIQITVLQDWRCQIPLTAENIQAILLSKEQSVIPLLAKWIDKVDAVWLIAPETDDVLTKLSQLVEEKSKVLLNSQSVAVAICSNKLATIEQLKKHAVPVVDTVQLNTSLPSWQSPWVVKTKDGVGCENIHYISDYNELGKLMTDLECLSRYVIQPYINGDSLSLSCLFKDGKAWLLCCNKQQILPQGGGFKLSACEVNISHNRQGWYQQLIAKVAKALPGLWGYVGIDIIQTVQGETLILEINPRLTTSFVGIKQATGVNVAKLVLAMIEGHPVIKTKQNEQITVLV